MITYQDLLESNNSDKEIIDFCLKAINEWKSSSTYKRAETAERYFRGENDILKYQKWLTKVTGEKIPDLSAANFKICSNYFERFVTQKVQFLLANGVSWNKIGTKDKIGTKKKPFDTQLQALATYACNGGVAFGMLDLDHIEIFNSLEFVPLYDEENGALMAGIRFWQITPGKPLRAVLYETDGYTQMIWNERNEKESGRIKKPKAAYKHKERRAAIGGSELYDFENYPSLPIVPLWGNKNHISDLTEPILSKINCYDLIYSGLANTIEEASYCYWILQNAGGMDEVDLQEFIDRIKDVHAVAIDDDVSAIPNTIQAPFEARQALLERIEKDLYSDAMALDVRNISGGAATATEIKAAYEPLNAKTDNFEYCVHQFVMGILELAGIDDKPTFTRSMLVNVEEEIQIILQAAAVLPSEYITEKILNLLGDADKSEEIIKQVTAERLQALTGAYNGAKEAESE